MFPRRIVAIGASSIYGRRDPDGGGFIGRLRRWHEPSHPANLVYNLGIGGETTAELLERFPIEVPRRRPELVILNVGLNDTRRTASRGAPPAVSITEHERHLNGLIDAAQAVGDLFVVGQFPIDESRTAPYLDGSSYYLLDDARAYVAVFRDLCQARNVPYLDLFAEWSPEGVLAFLDEDGLHCNSAGHQRIFHRLRARLEVLYDAAGGGGKVLGEPE